MRGLYRTIVLAAFLSVSAVAIVRPQSPSPLVARFVGTWRLASFESDSAGTARRGSRPTGLLMYDASGHMSVQIQPERRRASWPLGHQPTPEQALDAVTGYAAYFGTYTVDEKAHTVTHHREGALDFDAVDYVRRYEFDAKGRLILVPLDQPQNRLTWERIK